MKIIRLAYSKFVAANFAFFLFLFIVLLINGLSLFELSDLLQFFWFWLAFYPYAILASFVIDAILHIPKSKSRRFLPFFLYIGFGFLPFLFFHQEIPFMIIAGLVGAFAASLFFVGTLVATKNKWLAVFFAIFVPCLLLFVAWNDFTKKENWQEVKTVSSYKASFDYFNGEHRIPFNLRENQEVTFYIDIHANNGGGHGLHVENEHGDFVPMETPPGTMDADNNISFIAEETGMYFIVISGNRLRGGITVNWNIVEIGDGQ